MEINFKSTERHGSKAFTFLLGCDIKYKYSIFKYRWVIREWFKLAKYAFTVTWFTTHAGKCQFINTAET